MSDTSTRHTLFDTSAVIGLTERRSPTLVDIVKQLGRPIVRSITVTGELRHGAAVSDRPGQVERRRTLDRYEQLSAWTDLDVSLDDDAQSYAFVSAVATSHSVATGMNDRWIIAECLTQGAGLVTGDRRQAALAELVANGHVGARVGDLAGEAAGDFEVVLVDGA